jgi:protein SOK2
MSENPTSSAAMPNSNYPASEMGRHISPYSPPPTRMLQPYTLPPQQHEQSQDSQSPAQFQQYSYDIQLRYPAPSPSFPTPSMAGRYEPPRELPAPLPSMTTMQSQGGFGPPMEIDTTGQVPPPGVKPRVTATLWEDEGTLCFQVDVKGTCVARREGRRFANTNEMNPS